jgi:hypothetical protein
MNLHAVAPFWVLYHALPAEIQREADKAFALFQRDPFHPSLQFKELRGHPGYWSVRVGKRWRALAERRGGDVYWFWIGPHTAYDQLVDRLP